MENHDFYYIIGSWAHAPFPTLFIFSAACCSLSPSLISTSSRRRRRLPLFFNFHKQEEWNSRDARYWVSREKQLFVLWNIKILLTFFSFCVCVMLLNILKTEREQELGVKTRRSRQQTL
jgi:hypothetical protein